MYYVARNERRLNKLSNIFIDKLECSTLCHLVNVNLSWMRKHWVGHYFNLRIFLIRMCESLFHLIKNILIEFCLYYLIWYVLKEIFKWLFELYLLYTLMRYIVSCFIEGYLVFLSRINKIKIEIILKIFSWLKIILIEIYSLLTIQQISFQSFCVL